MPNSIENPLGDSGWTPPHAVEPERRQEVVPHLFSVLYHGNEPDYIYFVPPPPAPRPPIIFRQTTGGMLVLPAINNLPKWSETNLYESDYYFMIDCETILGTPQRHPEAILEVFYQEIVQKKL
jgi:hypothetical protein